MLIVMQLLVMVVGNVNNMNNKIKYQIMLYIPVGVMMFGHYSNIHWVFTLGMMILSVNIGTILSDIVDAIKSNKN